MPTSCKSLVMCNNQTNVKPMNIFFVWYSELCRRSNTCPLSIVKPPKPKNDTILDFTADRIKPEEWTPILTALRLDTSLHVIAIRSRVVGCKFLYDVNTEDKVKHMKRRCASLWTDYILRTVIRSLGSCIKNTQVLSTLELDGLPISGEYFEHMLEYLRHNRTIKVLSFKHCPINDVGCQQLCSHLRFMPNIEVLNLSLCSLTSVSGQYIAQVVKHQQINRYCESWHNSLRYEDPTSGMMAGLKRITLNNNPNIGDDGLKPILDILDDDLWIKAIDMQKCNITDQMSNRLIDVVEYSKSLEIADFRNNELPYVTVEKILEALQRKQQFGNNPEYKWYVTTTTLYDFGYGSSASSMAGVTTGIQKSKSAPLRQMDLESRSSKCTLRRIKTLTLLDKKPKHNCNAPPNKKEYDNAKKQLVDLHAKLHLEISKRKRTQKINNELQQKLEDMKKLDPSQEDFQDNLPTVKRIIENIALKDSDLGFPAMKELLPKKNTKERLPKTKTIYKPKTTKKVSNDRPKSAKKALQSRPQPKRVFSPAKKSPKEENMKVQDIFQKVLHDNDDKTDEETEDSDDQVHNFLSYFYNNGIDNDTVKAQSVPTSKTKNGRISPMSASDASLEKFLQELSDDSRNFSSETNQTLSNKASLKSSSSSKVQNKSSFKKIILGVS